MAYNSITLCGEQICDYLYIQSNAPDVDEFSCVNDEPLEWSDTTTLYADFNDKDRRLNAGNSKISGSIEGYQIYRQKYDESFVEYVGTVQKSEKNASDVMIDFSVKNGVDYTYYLYPNLEKTKSGTTLSPLVTRQLSIDCPYWSLFIVDDTNEDNVFYLDKMFKFELNIEAGDMTNNARVSISQNFTKYPTVQYGASNYWSGTLSALSGFISTNCIDYVQNTNMINELKQISSDTRRKFLKDVDGNLWEVNVSSPISISKFNAGLDSVHSWSFSWVEVGDANGVSIINNPSKPATSWVLTEDGIAIPYFTYQWGEQYKWDNSFFWTSKDNIYDTQNSNLGRKITE